MAVQTCGVCRLYVRHNDIETWDCGSQLLVVERARDAHLLLIRLCSDGFAVATSMSTVAVCDTKDTKWPSYTRELAVGK